MKIGQLVLVLHVLLSPLIGFSQNFNCNLTYLTTIQNFDVYQHDSSGAILYRAKFAIDADGSPRAYGPNNSGLDWTANAGSTGNWWGIVTDINGDPVIQGSGDPYPGMYVSTTSLVQSGYADTNPLRYVDSENIPYIAMPSALQSLGNISMGDLAYVKNITNGNVSFAYLADTGPGGKLGEGSMYLATALGINSSPKTGGTSQGIIDYIVFPQSGFGQGTHLDTNEIDSIGLIELTAAGGFNLPDCLDSVLPSLNCANAIPLTSGVTYSGASSSAASVITAFGCNNWTETGPERVHSIIPCGDAIITATLSNFTGDLDVYILGSCNPFDCLGSVSSSSATYSNAVAGQTYYIVVDADDGSGSAYDLLVDVNITGNNGTVGTDTQTACDSYTWIDGNTYTSSDSTATYTLVGGSVAGCDSVVTLNLTINKSTSGTDMQTACDMYTWIDGNTYTTSNTTATYTLTGGNATGCDSVVTLSLTIGGVDTAINLVNNVLIANLGGAMYQWIDCGTGMAIVGAINQYYTPTTNGDYAVIVTEGTCSDTSSCVNVTVTGVGEKSSGNTFSIYPNPITDHFTISFEKVIDIGGNLIRISNSLGQIVEKIISPDAMVEVDMQPFAKGIYVVRVSNSVGTQTVKVIKY